MPGVSFCGRPFSSAELQLIGAVVTRCAGLSRMELAHTVCELLHWQRPGGGLKARECREFLERLETQGVLQLPPKRPTKPVGSRTRVPLSERGEAAAALQGKLGAFEPIVLEPVQTQPQRLLYRELVGRHHYLGHAVPFGAHLRYLFYSGEQVLGAMQFSSPAWRMAVRERWIGWDEPARRGNLQRVVSQSRFLILPWCTLPTWPVWCSRARCGACARTGRPAMGSSRCWWRPWSMRAATAATATGRPTGSGWGRRPVAGAWTGGTSARGPRPRRCGSIRWWPMPHSGCGAWREGGAGAGGGGRVCHGTGRVCPADRVPAQRAQPGAQPQ
ncbi:MAG: DUF4338 domain-containing protein [Comamonadaceae bacterium]|nr:DUF4338 domain-containing protein [Comamonadaceae bacterium]